MIGEPTRIGRLRNLGKVARGSLLAGHPEGVQAAIAALVEMDRFLGDMARVTEPEREEGGTDAR